MRHLTTLLLTICLAMLAGKADAEESAPSAFADAAALATFHPTPAPVSAGLLLKKGDRLAICGDSITEQKMYSRIMEDYLTVCLPELKISVRQCGSDGVHPNWAGHTIMAYAFLKALGVEGDIAHFTVDLSAHELAVSEGHKLLSAHDGTFVIRSARYPFCSGGPMGLAANWYPTTGYDNITNNDSVRSGMTFVPFNQDLNRFTLTATHVSAEKYHVYWGDQDKVFSGDQLTRGLNLAEEFPLNPFSKQFALVDAAVSAKQDFETRQIKALFRPAGGDGQPEQIAAQTEKMLVETERIRTALEKVIQASYAPVTYTLAVTPE